ncbi:MAG: DUF3225 domain-containing protein [Candidatus Rokubacteria bacterium]|nr:DUF3225 domain-containing protein [Candidatus Rokubacteria bacterium]
MHLVKSRRTKESRRAASRTRVPAVDLARTLEHTIITTDGRDVTTTATEFTRVDWKVVSAHTSRGRETVHV